MKKKKEGEEEKLNNMNGGWINVCKRRTTIIGHEHVVSWARALKTETRNNRSFFENFLRIWRSVMHSGFFDIIFRRYVRIIIVNNGTT